MAQQEYEKPNILLITRNTQEQLDSTFNYQIGPREYDTIREPYYKKFIKNWISPALKRKDFSIKHTRKGRAVNVLAVTQDEYDYLTDPINHTMLYMICGAPIENIAIMDRAEFESKWSELKKYKRENKEQKFHNDIWTHKGRELLDELIELI